MICVRARTRDEAVACPACGTQTARVHQYQERTVTDVPAGGRRVVVKVRVRRMRCPVTGCPRQTFREQVPGVLDRYQRRTTRLTAQVSAVARELAGRVPARLLPALGIGVSRHAMLRVLLKIPLPALTVPRVLGIDDFAQTGPVSLDDGTQLAGLGDGVVRNRVSSAVSRAPPAGTSHTKPSQPTHLNSDRVDRGRARLLIRGFGVPGACPIEGSGTSAHGHSRSQRPPQRPA